MNTNSAADARPALLAAARAVYDDARTNRGETHSSAFDAAVSAMDKSFGASVEDFLDSDDYDDLLLEIDDWAGEPVALSSLAVEVQTRVADAQRGAEGRPGRDMPRAELETEFGVEAVARALRELGTAVAVEDDEDGRVIVVAL